MYNSYFIMMSIFFFIWNLLANKFLSEKQIIMSKIEFILIK